MPMEIEGLCLFWEKVRITRRFVLGEGSYLLDGVEQFQGH